MTQHACPVGCLDAQELQLSMLHLRPGDLMAISKTFPELRVGARITVPVRGVSWPFIVAAPVYGLLDKWWSAQRMHTASLDSGDATHAQCLTVSTWDNGAGTVPPALPVTPPRLPQPQCRPECTASDTGTVQTQSLTTPTPLHVLEVCMP